MDQLWDLKDPKRNAENILEGPASICISDFQCVVTYQKIAKRVTTYRQLEFVILYIFFDKNLLLLREIVDLDVLKL